MDAITPTWTLGDRLRKALATAGISQEEMAARLGISLGTIRNYESGRTHPQRATVLVWAIETNVDPDWLLADELSVSTRYVVDLREPSVSYQWEPDGFPEWMLAAS